MKLLIVLSATLVASLANPHYGYGHSSPYHHGLNHAYATPKEYYAEPYEHKQPQPYNFGYKVHDDGYGNSNYQEESGDSYGNKKGSYGYTDAHGIYRTVTYVADEHGFRAKISTNEPGTASSDPANVHIDSKPVQVVAAAPQYHAPIYAEAPHYAPSHYEPVSHAAPSHYEPAPHAAPSHYDAPHAASSHYEPYHAYKPIHHYAPPPTPYLPHGHHDSHDGHGYGSYHKKA